LLKMSIFDNGRFMDRPLHRETNSLRKNKKKRSVRSIAFLFMLPKMQ